MGVTQARKFQNYTPQKHLGAKIKVLRFHWMRVYNVLTTGDWVLVVWLYLDCFGWVGLGWFGLFLI